MIKSVGKVAAGMLLGGSLVFAGLTWDGADILNTTKADTQSYTAKTQQVIDLYKKQGERLSDIEGKLQTANLNNADLTKQLADLNVQHKELQKTYDALIKSNKETEDAKAALETQIAGLNQTIEDLRGQLATAKGETDTANKALGAAQAKLDELQEEYDYLYEAYEMTVRMSMERGWEIERLEGELTKANDDTSAFGEDMDEILDESVFDEVLPTTAE